MSNQALPPRSEKAFYERSLPPRGELAYQVIQLDANEINDMTNAIMRQRVRVFRDTYNQMTAAAGGQGRMSVLDEDTRRRLLGKSAQEAQQIADTYNRDARRAIASILEENPSFTRDQVATRLSAWNMSRESWKAPQIALWTELDTVQAAEDEFFRQNPTLAATAVAEASPRTAVCRVCQERVNMGKVSIAVSQANPFPAHVNCVHQWVITFPVKTERVNTGNWLSNIIRRLTRR